MGLAGRRIIWRGEDVGFAAWAQSHRRVTILLELASGFFNLRQSKLQARQRHHPHLVTRSSFSQRQISPIGIRMYRLLQRGPRSEIIELFTGKMLQLLLLRNLLHLIVIELIDMFREK